MSHTLLYGGTFDPIHHGHLITCLRAREILAADRVLFIPAGISPHKAGAAARTGASGKQRLAMIELAIAGIPGFAADGRELARPGPSYTVDTIEELLRERPAERLTLLIGADQLAKLHTWRRIGDLLGAKSAGGHDIGIAILARGEGGVDTDKENALSQVRSRLGQGVADRLAGSFLDTPRIGISATDIRQRLARRLPIDFLVPRAVAAYIHQHRLYQP